MTPYQATIAQVRAHLDETFSALDEWFAVDAAIRAYPPRDGGWTIDQNLEHITLTSLFCC